MDLKKAASLSGSDFLPLAVRLDELFAHLALMRSMTSSTVSPRAAASSSSSASAAMSLPAILEQHAPRMTDNGTEIIEAPRLAALTAAAAAAVGGIAQPAATAAAASRAAPAGSLESALLSMTEHVAQANDKSVALTCTGLSDVPAVYQGVVKNIVIQLIRNAVMHGIETPEERAAAGKPTFGSLTLSFEHRADESFQLSFIDDGRGLDAALLRATAIAKGIITAEAAEKLPDRQAIKLIFKKGFSTVCDSSAEAGRGIGMALVRRYVAENGGRVGLASVLGSQTRFRITLPPTPAASSQSQVA
jgi:signal transduction histidine kinase